MEIWKNVKYEGLEDYQISSKGRVKGFKGLMKSRVTDGRYNKIGLRYKKGKQRMFLVHRLVAEHFIDNPLNKPEVNHIDGNKNNNNSENLEWVTREENVKHAIDNGLIKINPNKIVRSKKYEKDISRLEILRMNAEEKRRPIRVINKKLGIDKEFESIYQAGISLECNEKTLRNVLKGRNKSRLGYECYYV